VSEAEEFKVYKAKDVQAALGISESAYYRLVNGGLLPYTRLTPGGDRVHLRSHLDTYLEYLAAQTKGGERLKPRP
jgi:hypothetical protein